VTDFTGEDNDNKEGGDSDFTEVKNVQSSAGSEGTLTTNATLTLNTYISVTTHPIQL
jgi:hypothetical protein